MDDILAKVGTLGGTSIVLARDEEDPYRKRYVAVLPDRYDFTGGTADQAMVDPNVRAWHIRSWRDGEGETTWSIDHPAFYNTAVNVRPVRTGDGLELGARNFASSDAGASTFNDARVFGLGLGGLWTVDDGDAWFRDITNERWEVAATVSTGAGASDCKSMADGDDTFMYSSHTSGSIWRWKSGTAGVEFYDSTPDGFTDPPILLEYDGILYALDGDTLYTVDKTVGAGVNTRVSKATPLGSSAVWRATEVAEINRLTSSDVGPIWLQRTDNGIAYIHEWNHSTSTHSIVGQLPNNWVFPYSIFYAFGFTWVGYRDAGQHSAKGEAFLFYKRGAQEGTIGPLRDINGNGGASEPVLIAGLLGDLIVVYYAGGVWGYNVSTGGLELIATQSTTGTPVSAVVFGKDVFCAPVTEDANTKAVEEVRSDLYTLETDGELRTGRYDFGYPGVAKILMDATLTFDALPANCTIDLDYSLDGGAWTSAGASYGTDNGTKTTWTISTNSATKTGVEVEFRIKLKTTNATQTPTIRSFTARATSAAKRIEWYLKLDCGTQEGSYQGYVVESAESIAALAALATGNSIEQFSDPWGVDVQDADATFDVMVEIVDVPTVGEREVAEVKLRTMGTV